MDFPNIRMRRLRHDSRVRRLVRENHLRVDQLIMPLFVEEGAGKTTPILSMPGQNRYTIDTLIKVVKECEVAGLGGIMLFGIPSEKDDTGVSAYSENGIVQKAVRALKQETNILLITDVCLCEYMSHGHCGILKNSSVDNDPSLEILSRTALSQVEAGADMVAPSDMMDGRIGAIRRVLDREGLTEIPIMSYAAKLASAFYGPFRDAADSAPLEGDRQGYQMDPANGLEAMREIELDIQEGADIIMVKPAMPCLDLIRSAADQFSHPLAAYQVSGEYLMLKAAAATGGIDEKRAVLESLLAIRRAGANIILTYYALEVANWLKEK